MNKLPKEITECEAFGYADDFKLVTTIPENIQKDISKVKDWCTASKLKLNKGNRYIFKKNINKA